ncbi:MAG: hypothetical protein ABRQ39_11200 [Candidatus Eremiobacterota bacterium]
MKYSIKGLTLTELMISAFIFLLCTSTVVSVWLCVRKIYTVDITTINSRRELRTALHRMNSDFKMAEIIYTGRSFIHKGKPYQIPPDPLYPGSPGYTIAVAVPVIDSDGIRSGNYTITGYFLEGQSNPDRYNPGAQQLVRFCYNTTEGTQVNPVNPLSINLQTVITSSDTNFTVLARYIEPQGLEFTVFDPPRGIKTAAVKVERKMANLPPVQQKIETGYFMRNNR